MVSKTFDDESLSLGPNDAQIQRIGESRGVTGQNPTATSVKVNISIIDENAFSRDCLARCLREIEREYAIWVYDSVNQWALGERGTGGVSVILLCAVGQRATEQAFRRDLALLKAADPASFCVIMSDCENTDQMLDAIEHGASGYIPSSIGLDVAVEAIRLVKAGGIFIPASALIRSRTTADQAASRNEGEGSLFTARQAEVVQALRRGMPNKLIAYELKMGECTVKVHIRNIMKKLNARNRTEVAFLTNSMYTSSN
jgi:DNA-binding NarL/FixJ family response regulator